MNFSFRVMACLALGCLLFVGELTALEFQAYEDGFVANDEVISDDIVMVGENLRIFGTMENDLIAAARSIVVKGTIKQDLMAAGETIDIAGRVDDDLRAVARTIDVTGEVRSNLSAFCQKLIVDDAGTIGGGILVGCDRAEIHGTVLGKAEIGANRVQIYGLLGDGASIRAQTVEIFGTIRGDVEIRAAKIQLHPSSQIEGDLRYRSPQKVSISDGAQVVGAVDWEKIVLDNDGQKQRWTVSFFIKMALFLGFALVGILVVTLLPTHAGLVAQTMANVPWKSLGWGFVFFVCCPVAVVIMFITVVGIPLAILSVLLYVGLLLLSGIFVGLRIGQALLGFFRKRVLPIYSVILGVIILIAATEIPYVGWLVSLLCSFAGMGALLLAMRKSWLESRAQGITR